jgi:cell division protein FtsX
MKLLIKETYRIIKSNLSSSLMVLILNGFMVLLAYSILIYGLNFNLIKNKIDSKFQAKIFLSDSASAKEIKSLSSEMRKEKIVKSVSFISSAEAQKIFATRFHNIDNKIVRQLSLPPSFDITFNDDTGYGDISSFLSNIGKQKLVDTVVFPHKIIYALARYFTFLMILFLIIFILVSIGIIFIIKHLFAKVLENDSEKIKIKHLIGAKRSTIVSPYYFASFLLCFISTLFTLFLLNFVVSEIFIFFNLKMLENKIVFSNIIILFLSLYVGYLVAPKNLHL